MANYTPHDPNSTASLFRKLCDALDTLNTLHEDFALFEGQREGLRTLNAAQTSELRSFIELNYTALPPSHAGAVARKLQFIEQRHGLR